jgi:hypothetical protein
MSITEYRSWVKFYAEEPFGDVRADLRAGIVSSLIARTMGGKKNAKPMDYMPIVAAQRDADAKAATHDQRVAGMRQVFEGNLGGMRVKRVRLQRE